MAHDETDHREDELPDVSYIKNVDVSHEMSDVKIRPIALFMFWLIIATAVISLLMAGLYKVFDSREQAKQGKPSPLAAERGVIPPEPRLQLAPTDAGQPTPRFIEDHPLRDMKKLREQEDAKLNNYGWIDQNAGVARIPIEDAKELLLKSGALKTTPAKSLTELSPFTAAIVSPEGGRGTPAAGRAQPVMRDNRPPDSSSGRWIQKQQKSGH